MGCIPLPAPPPLPPLGGVGLPSFSLPAPSLALGTCCRFNLQAYISLPALPGIPILSAALAVINADIALLDAYLAALDLISVPCPLE